MKFLNHITLNTGESRPSYRSEAADEVVAFLGPLVRKAEAGRRVEFNKRGYTIGRIAPEKPSRACVIWAINEPHDGPQWPRAIAHNPGGLWACFKARRGGSPTNQELLMDLRQAFADLPDPRIDRNKRHSLEDILVLSVCAFIWDANTWVDVETFGYAKYEWLRGFLALPHGIPSHDTLGRVFARLDPDRFRECFMRWAQSVAEVTPGEIVAIDGQTLRRSYDPADGRSAIHRISAWADANRRVLGQLKTEDKSNEITAIPELLKLRDPRRDGLSEGDRPNDY